LTLNLPYPVDDKKGQAKYDKNQKCLTVTLPVKPPTLPLSPPATPVIVDTTDDSKDSPTSESKSPTKPGSPDLNPSQRIALPKKEPHNRWVSGTSEEEKESAQKLKEEIRKQAEEALLQMPTLPAQPAPVEPIRNSDTTQGDIFIPSPSFSGRREGFVFKRGDRGVGYYLDKMVKLPPAQPKTAAVTLLEFPFEHRQTATSVAILVQIPSIDLSTVVIHFSPKLVQVEFLTTDVQRYALDLIPASEISVENSKYDVVQRNMCIVLAKQVERIWEGDIVVSRPHSGSKLAPKQKTISSVAAPAKDITDADATLKSLEGMSFSSGGDLLFELD